MLQPPEGAPDHQHRGHYPREHYQQVRLNGTPTRTVVNYLAQGVVQVVEGHNVDDVSGWLILRRQQRAELPTADHPRYAPLLPERRLAPGNLLRFGLEYHSDGPAGNARVDSGLDAGGLAHLQVAVAFKPRIVSCLRWGPDISPLCFPRLAQERKEEISETFEERT